MEKVLVIGSNSFSGSDFIDYLLEVGEYEVFATSRSEEKSAPFLSYKARDQYVPFYQIDLNTGLSELSNLLDRLQPDYIVNFAAQSEVAPSWKNPDHWFQTNAVAITNLANLIKDYKNLKKYVHISSPEVYGTCEGTVTEKAPLNPSTPYAASKAAGDMSLFTFFKNFDLPLVMVRATNVYGPAQQLFKIIPRTVLQVLSGGKIHLHGGGAAVKSYIHIRDVSRGELMIMKKGRSGEIYHLSPPQGISVKAVVEMICQKMCVDPKQFIEIAPERLGQDKAYIIDSAKAQSELNWQVKISMEEGIQQTIDWIRENYTLLQSFSKEYVHKA